MSISWCKPMRFKTSKWMKPFRYNCGPCVSDPAAVYRHHVQLVLHTPKLFLGGVVIMWGA